MNVARSVTICILMLSHAARCGVGQVPVDKIKPSVEADATIQQSAALVETPALAVQTSSTCGNGVVESGEECEPGVSGLCPPGRCITAGQPRECTCIPICTFENWCVLHDGENGPFVGPFDPIFGGVFVYTSDGIAPAFSIDFCGSNGVDTVMNVFFGPTGLRIASNNDCCDPLDPTCGAKGVGSTPSASCFNQVTSPNYESCTCLHSSISALYIIQLGNIVPVGASIQVNINTLASCVVTSLGSCCDTNGSDAGCANNVAQTACVGPDKQWSSDVCANRICDCIPVCGSRVCGDNGCGGSCGTCDDKIPCTIDACVNGQCTSMPNHEVCNDHDACNGVETCGPSGCVSGAPVNCDDGVFCNGLESCVQDTCVSGIPPCATDEICDDAGHTCSPRFVPIPTVSQWGLVVIGLTILIAAKYRSQRDRRLSRQ